MDVSKMADALAGADVATLRRLGEERAAIAEWMERAWTEKHGGVPADIAEQKRDHRIVAALALAIAEMQERQLEVVVTGFSRVKVVDYLYTGDGEAGMLTNEATLPAALASLLRKP